MAMNQVFKSRYFKCLLICIGIVLLILLPSILPSFYVFLGTKILFLGLTAMSLILVFGYGGMLSFAQVAFMGISSYMVAIMVVKQGAGYGFAVVIALLVAVGIGALFGLVAIRTKGNYFLMMTLAFGQLLYLCALQWVTVLGGFNGITGVEIPKFTGLNLEEVTPMYYVVLVVVALCFIALKRIVISPYGIALQGTRDNAKKMNALGFNSQAIRFLAVVLSALFAGIAGCLNVTFYKMAAPDMVNLSASVVILFIVLIGGYKKIEGALLGSLIYVILQDVLSQYTDRYNLIIGIFFIVVVLLLPEGILGAKIRRFKKKSNLQNESGLK